MSLKDLTIGRRLGLGFLAVVLSMVALVVAGVYQVNRIDTKLTTINDQNAVKQRYAINFRGSVHDRAISLRDVVLATSAAEVRPEIDLIEELAGKYADVGREDGRRSSPTRRRSATRRRARYADIKARAAGDAADDRARSSSLREAGDRTQACSLLVQDAKPAFVEWLRGRSTSASTSRSR